MRMPEAHELPEGSDQRALPSHEHGVMLSVRIESKLGLEPSEHRSSRPKDAEPMPAKRARLHRQTQRVNPS